MVEAPVLQAVVAADVVGFSAHMERDPDRTIQAVLAARHRMAELARFYGGSLRATPGDFLLAFFPNVNGALEAARALVAPAEADEELSYRVGIDVGEVFEAGDDMLGPAINVAARLQQAARPGTVVLSGSAFASLSRRGDYAFHALGALSLKNLAQPVEAHELLLDGREQPPAPLGDALERFVLVLRDFEAIGDSSRARLFAEGLTDELQTVLGSFSGAIDVRRTVDALKTAGAYELTGRVRNGNRLRITARLTALTDGHSLWSGRYDYAPDASYDAQEEIARRVIEAAQVELSDGEWARIWSGVSTTLDAWEAFQKGRVHEARVRREDLKKAREYYRTALELDPNFTPAKVSLAFCLIDEIRLGWSRDKEAALAEARRLQGEAIARHPEDGYARALQAFIVSVAGRREEACALMRQVVLDEPESPELLAYYAVLLGHMGNTAEAVSFYEHALKLTPHPPSWIRANLALALMIRGDARARAQFEAILSGNPDNVRAHVGMVVMTLRDDRPEDARSWAARLKALEPDFAADRWRAPECFADLGVHRQIADELRRAGL